jgi:hypothetical protein
MTENCVNLNTVRDIWNWVTERWAYFAVGVITYLLMYYITGSTIQAVSGIIVFMLMCLGVIWVNRLPRDDRVWWKRLVGITMILLAITVAITYNPVNALSLDYEFEDTQIIWTWNDGEPPYNVWDSNGLIAEGYPYDWMIRDVEPGKTYTLAVQDAANSTNALTAKAPYYTFTTEIWILIALFIALALLSIWIPYAAFACAALGGFLMMMIVPDTNYAGYLRIVAATLFIVGLGTIYIHGVSR